MNNDCQLIFEAYKNSQAEIFKTITQIKNTLQTNKSTLGEKEYKIIVNILNSLNSTYRHYVIDKLNQEKLLPSEFWNYVIDNNLLKKDEDNTKVSTSTIQKQISKIKPPKAEKPYKDSFGYEDDDEDEDNKGLTDDDVKDIESGIEEIKGERDDREQSDIKIAKNFVNRINNCKDMDEIMLYISDLNRSNLKLASTLIATILYNKDEEPFTSFVKEKLPEIIKRK
jgi:hypothetical protein